MPTSADQRRKEARQPLHPPKKYHHAPSIPKRRAPSNTFKKECDDAAAVARTSSRVSPGTRGVVGKGYIRRPSGGTDGACRRHRVGAGQADMDFSRSTTTTTTPSISTCITPTSAHQRVPPRLPGNPRRLTGAANTRPGDGKGTTATGAITTRPEEGNNRHRLNGADRTWRQGLVGHRMPGRALLEKAC